ncbi:hypothetical protein HZY62_21665 [Maribacter polysiphoniae]|uniref:Uncharacterized protein n=1 Tax=Maribacter polysiphoniae TaxID=429344 RepID=A0A316DIH7_9FLAO|nr:hypothetical protein [Maribacter polysiphoniae]MBD1263209.1 hypothetical protein [Maribacter polysiphoniae]PWK17486.1 hypothetical protein LX92_04433 [Maribacter polysiphoniae]
MIKRKTIIILAIGLFLIVLCYVFIKFYNVSNIENNCLVNDFNAVFEKENSIKLDETYDFSKILNCKNWDEVIIVSGERVSRTAIFLKEGIALPKIDYYFSYPNGSLVLYLVKDGELISSPLSYWQSGFLYLEGLNSFDYVRLEREEAIFKCVELETIGSDEEMLTFELIMD